MDAAETIAFINHMEMCSLETIEHYVMQLINPCASITLFQIEFNKEINQIQ